MSEFTSNSHEIEHAKSWRTHKGKSIISVRNEYVAIDVETTGLDPMFDEIIEIAAVRVSGGNIIECFQSLVKPPFEIDAFITNLTGITNEMLSTAPNISEVLPLFVNFVGNSVVLGHNVNFDINFLYDKCERVLSAPFKNDFIDTMRLSRRLFPEHKHHRLSDLGERFCICSNEAHRALSDARNAHDCYTYMKQYIAENGIEIESLIPQNHHLRMDRIEPQTNELDETSPAYGMLFVFTGRLDRMSRREAMQLVVNVGGKIADTVTKKTNYLVLGCNDYCCSIKDGKSEKQKKAELLRLDGCNIQVISENIFYDMVLKDISR